MIGPATNNIADRRAMPLPLTAHAVRRSRERSIPEFIIEALLDYGDRHPAPGNAERIVFGRRGWARFAKRLGREARHFERYRRVYLIVSNDGYVITAAWQDG